MILGNVGKVLNIQDLKYSVKGIHILKGINMEVGAGEFVGLIGPNGAGKTTLLKCINGINKGQGVIKIKGNSLEQMTTRNIAQEVALMHQNTTINFPFSAFDIVLSGRYPHLNRLGGESRKDYNIAKKNMEYTDTFKFERIPITQISGGERQKVFFAKVLTQDTDLILLDEPSSNLDIAHEEQIFQYSGEICKQGKTVIAAVHDLKAAVRYCTRLVLMKDGFIISDGTADEVLTTENLSKAYGVNAIVYRNRVTGLLDFHIHGMEKTIPGKKIHVIGGGGSASSVIRMLFENGFKISAGVFAHGDSDMSCSEIYGIKCIACKPFSEIDNDSFMENINLIKNADLTILCDMPFGFQNIKNLEAAEYAKKLIIIEDEEPKGRDYTGGKALGIYMKLRNKAVITTIARLHEVL